MTEAHPSDSLMPCPFDGEPAHLIEGHRNHWRAQCKRCGASIGDFFAAKSERENKADATEAWNRRALAAPGGEGEPVACLSGSEQKSQAERCSCRGVDDYCPCQNVPDSQTMKDRSDA